MASKIGKFITSMKSSIMGIKKRKEKFQRKAKKYKAQKAAKSQANWNKDVGGPAGSYFMSGGEKKKRLNAASN